MGADVPVPPFPEWTGISAFAIGWALVRLTLDFLALGVIARAITQAWGAPRDVVGTCLVLGLAGLAVLTAGSLLLGYTGAYAPDLLSLWLLGLAGLAGLWLKTRRSALVPPAICARVRREWAMRSTTERLLVALIVMVLMGYGLTAALTTPLGYDENAYRLPRIATWLSTGSIRHFASGNERMSYMPIGVDLVQTWLCGHFPRHFPLVALAGWFGGVLSILATLGLGRLLRLPLSARLLAALLLLLLPNTQAQFMTAQTDLLTTGLFAGGVCLLWRSLVTSRFSGYACLGLGLACAAKGTAYFIGSGFALATLVAMILRPRARRLLLPTGAGIVLAWAAFAAPRHIENALAFRSLFGPPSSVDEHTAGGVAQGWADLGRDTVAWALQNLHPAANPPGLDGALAAAMRHGVRSYVSDASVGVAFDHSRRSSLERLLAQERPDADAVSLGLLPTVAVAWGLAVMLFQGSRLPRRHHLPPALLAIALVVSYVVFSVALEWQLYAYRLLLPWMPFACLAIIWPWRSKVTRLGWIAVSFLLLQVATAFSTYLSGAQYGLNGSLFAHRQPIARYRLEQGALMHRLAESTRLVAVATGNHYIGGFFRSGAPVSVVTMSPTQAAAFVQALRSETDPSWAVLLPQSSPLLEESSADFRRSNLSVANNDPLSFALIQPR